MSDDKPAMKRRLLVTAHPDDEAMHTGLVLAGECWVLVATDGAGGTAMGHEPGAGLARCRRQESGRALAALGVPEERRIYPEDFGVQAFADGALGTKVNELAKLIGRVARHYGIGQVFTAGPEGYDGHADHRAGHAAAWAAVDDGADLEVWGLVAARPDLGLVAGDDDLWIAASDEVRRARFAAMACHESQFEVRRLAEGEAVRTGELERLGFAIGREFWEQRFRVYWLLIEEGERYSRRRG